MSLRFIGILPAAGMGTRLAPFRYSKELLPIVFMYDEDQQKARPMLSGEYSLRTLQMAKIECCYMIVADWKTEIIRYFGDGSEFGVSVAYLHRRVPRGLADAVDAAYPWLGDAYTCLALPDTIFYPTDAVAVICEEVRCTGVDLVLGVFPTDEPEHLGPVRIAADGRVECVLDKPEHTDLKNTWGVAAWSPKFTQLLHERVTNRHDGDAELPLGNVFHAAVEKGLSVRAVYFPGGSYLDVGRAETLGSLVVGSTHQEYVQK